MTAAQLAAIIDPIKHSLLNSNGLSGLSSYLGNSGLSAAVAAEEAVPWRRRYATGKKPKNYWRKGQKDSPETCAKRSATLKARNAAKRLAQAQRDAGIKPGSQFRPPDGRTKRRES